MNRKQLYDGKAKTIFEGPEPGTVIQYFKDDATAFNVAKHNVITGKGVLNNRISSHIMTKLEEMGIPTHFMRQLNMREQLVRQVEIIPVELVIRNVAAGSICSRYSVKEGTIFSQPIVEYFYKNDELNDPLVSESHIINFGWADPYELEEMVGLAYRINDYLSGLFQGVGLRLIDFKLEFGRLWGEYDDLYILLADEISPDNCRLWDVKTGEKMDKGRDKKDPAELAYGYQEVAKRFGLIPESGIFEGGSVNESVVEGLSGIENPQIKERRLRSVNKITPKNPRKS